MYLNARHLVHDPLISFTHPHQSWLFTHSCCIVYLQSTIFIFAWPKKIIFFLLKACFPNKQTEILWSSCFCECQLILHLKNSENALSFSGVHPRPPKKSPFSGIHAHRLRPMGRHFYFFYYEKQCSIAAKIAGLIGILPCCVLNDFFTFCVWEIRSGCNTCITYFTGWQTPAIRMNTKMLNAFLLFSHKRNNEMSWNFHRLVLLHISWFL